MVEEEEEEVDGRKVALLGLGWVFEWEGRRCCGMASSGCWLSLDNLGVFVLFFMFPFINAIRLAGDARFKSAQERRYA